MSILTESPTPHLRFSEARDLLTLALSRAQAKMGVVKPKTTHSHFKHKYATFAAFVQEHRKILAEEKLAVTQTFEVEKEVLKLYTTLGHASGQWVESMIIIPFQTGLKNIQDLGSAISYLKRYSYAALINGIADDLEDDDGEKFASKGRAQKKEYITQDQLSVISEMIGENEELLDTILAGLKINKLSQVEGKDYNKVIKHLREAQV